jgi:hypothetical protein
MTHMEQQVCSLVAELRAIQLWDCIYVLSDGHDAVEEAAWEARRDRQAEIYKQLAYPE